MKRGLIQWNRNEVPEKEFESRIQKTKSIMKFRGVDAVAIYGDACQSNNLTYLTNFFPYADTGLFVLPLSESPRLFTTHAYRNIPWFNTITWVKDIICADDIGGECVKFLKAVNLAGKKIGIIDNRSFPYPIYSRLQDGASRDFVDLTEDFEKIRMIKSKVELHFIKEAAHIAGMSFEKVKKAFQRGITGYDLASEVELIARKNGAEDVLCLIQPDFSPLGLSLPTSDPFETMCSVEISVEYQGHWARLGRTLITTDAPQEFAVKLKEFLQFYQSAAKKLQVGISFASWAAELRTQIDNLDMVENIEVYSDPGLEPYWGIHRNTDGVFQNGMAFYTKVILRLKDKLQMALSDTYTFENYGVTAPDDL
ncbi:MAG: aminopeptidase P family N-terminal domain-containing protein [Candidatus Aminicenantes bacterium]|nr:aminopeptidase P family N-terminal domain-containing protein [Candidatus Aminicenantes bacterium]